MPLSGRRDGFTRGYDSFFPVANSLITGPVASCPGGQGSELNCAMQPARASRASTSAPYGSSFDSFLAVLCSPLPTKSPSLHLSNTELPDSSDEKAPPKDMECMFALSTPTPQH